MPQITHYKAAGSACVLSHYTSIADMREDCFVRPMTQQGNVARLAELERDKGKTSWYGVPSLDEVKRILSEGYADGAQQAETIYAKIAPTLPHAVEYRRRRVRADQGDSLDIHAVNRGDLTRAWETARRKATLGSGLIRVTVDICGNGDMSADTLRWRGIAALALTRALTKAGYSVEIVAGQSGNKALTENLTDLLTTITVTVKPRNVAVDVATLAAAVCLPGFFRYLGFASIIRQADDLGVCVRSGLGQAVKLETVLPVPEKITQVIVSETVHDEATAIAWVKDAVILLQSSTVSRENSR